MCFVCILRLSFFFATAVALLRSLGVLGAVVRVHGCRVSVCTLCRGGIMGTFRPQYLPGRFRNFPRGFWHGVLDADFGCCLRQVRFIFHSAQYIHGGMSPLFTDWRGHGLLPRDFELSTIRTFCYRFTRFLAHLQTLPKHFTGYFLCCARKVRR